MRSMLVRNNEGETVYSQGGNDDRELLTNFAVWQAYCIEGENGWTEAYHITMYTIPDRPQAARDTQKTT